MTGSTTLLLLSVLTVLCMIHYVEAGDKKLQIGVKKRIPAEDCKMKSRKGDRLEMHYTVRVGVQRTTLILIDICVATDFMLNKT